MNELKLKNGQPKVDPGRTAPEQFRDGFIAFSRPTLAWNAYASVKSTLSGKLFNRRKVAIGSNSWVPVMHNWRDFLIFRIGGACQYLNQLHKPPFQPVKAIKLAGTTNPAFTTVPSFFSPYQGGNSHA